VCLVALPFFRKEDVFNVHIPLSLFSIATALVGVNIETSIVDLQVLIKSKHLSFNKNFFEGTLRFIEKEFPSIVGFTSNCVQYPLMVELARYYKKRNPKIPVVLGGPQASVTDISTLSCFPWFDVIVRGDGETVIKDLCLNILHNKSLEDVAGITWRDKKGHIHQNTGRPIEKDLDKIPFPNYNICPTIAPYLLYSDAFPIEAGRGCPYKCKFCHYSNPLSNNSYRSRSASNIVKHIKMLNNEYGIKRFIIEHDNFTSNPKRLIEFCTEIKKHELDIQWYCDSRIESLNDKIITMLALAGCKSIFSGVESASPRIQQNIGKQVDTANIYSIINKCNLNGIKCRTAFMIGFPGEHNSDKNQTLEMMLNLVLNHPKNDIVFNVVHPHFGSTYYNSFAKDIKLVNFGSALQHLKYDYIPRKHYKKIHKNISNKPDLFSYFYYFNEGLDKVDFNLSLQEYYPLVLQYYPKTFHAICRYCKTTPLQLFNHLYKHLIKQTKRATDRESFFHNCFASLIGDHFEKHRIPKDIRSVLKNEIISAGLDLKKNSLEYSSEGFFS